MKRLLIIAITFILGFAVVAGKREMNYTRKYIPIEKIIFYKLSENIIPIRIQQYGESTDFIFINLHDDEFTSVTAAKSILEKYGGTLIEIENNLERNIRFRIGKTFYRVDPNQIFSQPGIERSLKKLGRTSPLAITEAEKFGIRILQLIPEEARCIIALHNNTPGFFSVIDYTPGNDRAKEVKKVFTNPEKDPDDFFLTTDRHLYEKLSGKGFNIVLQDNTNCTEDGSLSVYFGRRGVRYVNCETEHGKTSEYNLMLTALMESIN